MSNARRFVVALAMLLGSSTAWSQVINQVLTTFVDARKAGPGSCAAAQANGSDDFAALDCKLTSLASTGGILYIPAGTYYVSQTLNVPQNVSVRGTGYGSVLQQKHTLTSSLVTLSNFSELRDIELTQEQPAVVSNWTPYLDYDYQVKVLGYSANIENVMLLSPTKGISIRSWVDQNQVIHYVGKARVNNVRGQPLLSGIYLDGITDITRIEDIHFWPWWSQSSFVQDYVRGHAVGIESYRDDNPYFSNIFTFGYHFGFHFGTSPAPTPPITGITSRATVSGYNCDVCWLGVYVDGPYTNGLQFDRVYINSSSDIDTQPQIMTNAIGISMIISKLDSVSSPNEVVRVLGTYNSVIVSDSLVRSWNLSNHAYPAFDLVGTTGSVMSLTNILYNQGLNGTPYAGATFVSGVTYAPGL